MYLSVGKGIKKLEFTFIILTKRDSYIWMLQQWVTVLHSSSTRCCSSYASLGHIVSCFSLINSLFSYIVFSVLVVIQAHTNHVLYGFMTGLCNFFNMVSLPLRKINLSSGVSEAMLAWRSASWLHIVTSLVKLEVHLGFRIATCLRKLNYFEEKSILGFRIAYESFFFFFHMHTSVIHILSDNIVCFNYRRSKCLTIISLCGTVISIVKIFIHIILLGFWRLYTAKQQCLTRDHMRILRKLKKLKLLSMDLSAHPVQRESLGVSNSKNAENHCASILHLLFHCLLHSEQELDQKKKRKKCL